MSLDALLLRARQGLARLKLHSGFEDEMRFWRKELTLEGEYPQEVAATLDPALMESAYPAGLDSYVDELRERFGPGLRALDVGCGPASVLGFGQVTGRFELTGVDPLADQYREVLEREGHAEHSALVQGFGEDLGTLFAAESFDLVYSRNALDHTQSPGETVRQMARVLKPGGVLFLQTYVREGTANNFHGLHQHDLYLEAEGRLLCRTRLWPLRRGGRARCISGGLGLEIAEQSDPSIEVRSDLKAVYRKRG